MKMSASGEPENIAKQMVDFANQPKKGADNITVSLIEIVEKAKKHKGLVRKRDRKPDLEEWQNAETEYSARTTRTGWKKTKSIDDYFTGISRCCGCFGLYRA